MATRNTLRRFSSAKKPLFELSDIVTLFTSIEAESYHLDDFFSHFLCVVMVLAGFH